MRSSHVPSRARRPAAVCAAILAGVVAWSGAEGDAQAASRPVRPQEPSAPLEFAARLSPTRLVRGQTLTIELTVANRGASIARRAFNSGCQFGFALRDGKGAIAAPPPPLCTMVAGTLQWQPGEVVTRRFTWTWDGSEPAPGRYVVVAGLGPLGEGESAAGLAIELVPDVPPPPSPPPSPVPSPVPSPAPPGIASDETRADLDGDGRVEDVRVTFFESGGYGFDTAVLAVGTTLLAVRGASLRPQLHVLDLDKRDAWLEIAISEYGPSDDYATHVFRYVTGHLLELGTVPGIVGDDLQVDGAGHLHTRCRGQVLHTWFHPCSFHVDQWSGRLEPDALSEIAMGTPVTLKCDLPVYGERYRSRVTGTIGAGERAVIERTDGRSWCFIRSARGVAGWFGVVGFSQIAGTGREAQEVFDGLSSAD